MPDPPVGEPSVSDVTLRSVTLSWYGPAYDGGCPITNYRVELCDAEDQEWKPVTSSCKVGWITLCFLLTFMENLKVMEIIKLFGSYVGNP